MSKSLIELAEVTTLGGNDEILVNSGGNPRRISIRNLFTNTTIDGVSVGISGNTVASHIDTTLEGGDGISVTGTLLNDDTVTIAVDGSVVRDVRALNAGTGLTGGGNLSVDRTLAVDSTVVRTVGDFTMAGTLDVAALTVNGTPVDNTASTELTTRYTIPAAEGDDTTDDRAAIQTALDTGNDVYLGPGRYYVTDELTLKAQYQTLKGAGIGKTILSIKPDFNKSANGVINMGEWYTSVEDLSIEFDQSAATSRVTLEGYPPGIYANQRARTALRRIRMYRAETGVYYMGNTGGSVWEDVEVGSFTYGFHVLGTASDSMYMNRCRVWPHGILDGGSLESFVYDGTNVGFQLHRIDDLRMSDCLVFRAKINISDTDGVGGFGGITGLACDGDPTTLNIQAGKYDIASIYCTRGLSADSPLIIVDGTETRVTVSSFNFFVSNEHTDSLVQVKGGDAIFSAGTYRVGNNDNLCFDCTGGQLTAQGINFKSVDATRTRPLIKQSSFGDIIVKGCRAGVLSSGSGVFCEINSDRYHIVEGNHTGGLTLDIKTTLTNSQIGPNFIEDIEIDEPVILKGGVNMERVVIAQDSTATITPPANNGIIRVFGNAAACGDVGYSTAGTLVTTLLSGGGDLEVTTGNLTGTTGSNSKLTVSAKSGEIEIENQLNAAVSLNYMFFY